MAILPLAIGIGLVARPAAAGQSSEASIVGQVTDESGAALPGVSVSASSPALKVPEVISITNEQGEYRLSLSGDLNEKPQLVAENPAAEARQVLSTGGRQIPSIVLNVEPIGTRRLPNTNLLDRRLEKSLRLAKGNKVALRVNLYNTLNVNTITAQTLLSGGNFLKPTAFVPPRFIEFGASYNF